MSFETSLKKLQKLWDAGQENEFNLELARLDLYVDSQNKENLVPKITSFNRLEEIGGDYEPLNILVDSFTGNISFQKVFGFQWKITIDNFPQDWIPFARPNVGMNWVGAEPVVNLFPDLQWFVEVEEPPLVDNFGHTIPNKIAKVSWHVATSLSEPTMPDFKVKLYLTLISPLILE